MQCPNGIEQPIYDNSFSPPRLVGFTKGSHVFKITFTKTIVNGEEVTITKKICIYCGLEILG